MSEYESPIKIYALSAEELATERDNFLKDAIMESVEKFMIQVDPDELQKALAYDREQYELGYRQGKIDATRENTETEIAIHAKWVNETRFDANGQPYNLTVCSSCGFMMNNEVFFEPWTFKRCPDCGAKMGGRWMNKESET